MKELSILLSLFISLILATPALAHCPLCVAATGSAVAAARFYGVPDLITGTFIGAFILSIAAWANKLLKKRNKGRDYLPFQPVILAIFWLLLFIFIFFMGGLVLTLFDKLIVGMLAGTVITLLAFSFSNSLRESNEGKNYIPLQVIFVTLTFLLLSVFGYYVVGFV